MSIELIEVEPGKWRVKREERRPARSDLPLPFVISDIMEPTEQVDGKFYTSKSEFRRVGRSHGLTEVGTEKLKPRTKRASDDPVEKKKRRNSIGAAISQYKAGRRV